MELSETLQLRMNRRGFGLKGETQGDLNRHYYSQLIQEIKDSGYTKTFGSLTVHLAQEFGFCYGVDRAVLLAYETRRQYPEKQIFLTTEIIHNPLVNTNLKKMGVSFLAGPYKDAELDDIRPQDVVIVPAFGTTTSILAQLVDKKCELVDTICGSVMVVWKRVEKYALEGFTAVVHGKSYHEETQATTSRVAAMPGGKFVVVFDEEEAGAVYDYITRGGDKESFIKRFSKPNVLSQDFDPNRDLVRVGLANQTTMLSSESLKIAGMIKSAMAERYGEDHLEEHFRSFDTICNATQERQDAIIAMKDKRPDLIIVIGGYNSSNTNHLCEIASKIAATYHIDRADCVVSEGLIRHKPFGSKHEIETPTWLRSGPVSIGITAGASTPNQVMGETIERIASFRS